MSTVYIDYERLSTISKNASNASSKMQDYINDLTKKVSNKYSDINGGASTKTINSEYYVNQKISQLKKKKQYYSTFSKAINTFSNNAHEIDKSVANKLKASKDKFIDKHDYINVNWWTELKEFFVDLKNSCPLFETISNLIDRNMDKLNNLMADLRYWYRCGGGKEIVGCVLAIGGAVVSCVIAVCAILSLGGFVAFFAMISALITAVNALYNVYSSQKALVAKLNGDPAWAQIYEDQDTVQDFLRDTNFKNGIANKLSYLGAGTIDFVKTICDFVTIVDSIKNVCKTVKEIKAYANRSQVRDFKDVLIMYIKNEKNYKGVKVRDYIQARVTGPLSKEQRIIKEIKTGAKLVDNSLNYSQKIYDYSLGGDFSIKNLGKDIAKGVSKKLEKNFKTYEAGKKIYDLKNNFKSLESDFNGMRANYKYGYTY